jgi:hypothetical protein
MKRGWGLARAALPHPIRHAGTQLTRVSDSRTRFLGDGRRRWIEQMKAEGKKFPWGRKAGYQWTTPGMREREIRVLQESVALPGRHSGF